MKTQNFKMEKPFLTGFLVMLGLGLAQFLLALMAFATPFVLGLLSTIGL